MIKNRYHNIDLIEFFAMMFVIMYHSNSVLLNFNDSTVGLINYLLRPILTTGVPLFLFCNGFLLIQKKFDMQKHLKKTVKFVIITVIWAFINIIALMPLKKEMLSVKEIILAFIDWKPGWINHFWFMGILVCIYFFFPLIKNSYEQNSKVLNYWTVICVIFVFGNVVLSMCETILLYAVTGNLHHVARNYFSIFNPINSFSNIYMIAYFSIGCYVGANKETLKTKVEKSVLRSKALQVILLFVSVLGLGLWSIYEVKATEGNWDVVWDGYGSVFTPINVLLIYLLSMNYKYNPKNPVCKFIQLVSCNTLGVFFMHKIVCTAFENTGLLQLPFMQNYLTNFIYALVVAVICVSAALILKKIPVLKNLVA